MMPKQKRKNKLNFSVLIKFHVRIVLHSNKIKKKWYLGKHPIEDTEEEWRPIEGEYIDWSSMWACLWKMSLGKWFLLLGMKKIYNLKYDCK